MYQVCECEMHLSRCLTRKLILGRSQDSLVTPSANLHEEAQVVAVGIAEALQEELEIIATDPERNVFNVGNFDELSQFARNVSDAVCFAGRFEEVLEAWSEWALWGECSVSCGFGTRVRTRICMDGEFGSPGCEGFADESGVCGGSVSCLQQMGKSSNDCINCDLCNDKDLNSDSISFAIADF